MKLIDKDALVAEIVRRYKLVDKYETNEFCAVASRDELVHLRNFIKTLEVKEVDLDKEVDAVMKRFLGNITCREEQLKFAKHFFEFGLQAAQKEESKTDWLRELKERLDSLSKEDFEKVIAKYSRYGEEGSVDYDKLNTMLDESLSKETKESWNKRLGEEPVSEDLEDACEQLSENARKHKAETSSPFFSQTDYRQGVMDGAKWQKNHLWKPANGDDLPEYDREVIAILDYDFGHYKVVYAHRPNPNGWNGTNIDTGKKEHFEPEIYDKGGWNQPHVLYWLDARLPYEEK